MAVIEVTPTARPEVKILLSEPLMTHEGMKTELVFKSPSAKALMKYGDPIKSHVKGSGAEAEIHRVVNYQAVFHIAAAATGIEEGLLSDVCITDADAVAGAVVDIMRPTLRKNISE